MNGKYLWSFLWLTLYAWKKWKQRQWCISMYWSSISKSKYFKKSKNHIWGERNANFAVFINSPCKTTGQGRKVKFGVSRKNVNYLELVFVWGTQTEIPKLLNVLLFNSFGDTLQYRSWPLNLTYTVVKKHDPWYIFKWLQQILINIHNFWSTEYARSLRCSHMYYLRVLMKQGTSLG